MQCFKGYKVIPSQPYPSAHIPNDFSVWVSFNIATLSLLWSLKGYLQSAQTSQGGHKALGGCTALASLGPLDWCFNLFDFVGAFLWWWISFSRLLLILRNGAPCPLQHGRSLGVTSLTFSIIHTLALWQRFRDGRLLPRGFVKG